MYTVKLTSCEITVRIIIQKQNVLLHCLVDSSTILLIRLISVILNINSIYVYIYTYIYIYYTILLYIYTILYYCIYIYYTILLYIYTCIYYTIVYIHIFLFYLSLYIVQSISNRKHGIKVLNKKNFKPQIIFQKRGSLLHLYCCIILVFIAKYFAFCFY